MHMDLSAPMEWAEFAKKWREAAKKVDPALLHFGAADFEEGDSLPIGRSGKLRLILGFVDLYKNQSTLSP